MIKKLLLILIIIVGGFWRFWNLESPTTYVFDEIYHVPTMKAIAHSQPRAYEWWHKEIEGEETGAYIDWLHPPLAKIFGAWSILIFGEENSWAWRAPSALAGTLLILAVYLLTQALFPQKKWASLLAALLVAIDGLSLAQSRIAMNDIWVTLWLTLSLYAYWCYQKKEGHLWWWLTVLSAGAAVASKWSGFTIMLFFLVYEIYKLIKKKTNWQKSLAFLSSTSILVGIIYIISYGQMFLYHDFNHFKLLQEQILNYQFGLKEGHPYASRAWWWPLGEKPVFFYTNQDGTIQIWNKPFYFTWYLGLFSLLISLVLTISSHLKKFYQKRISSLKKKSYWQQYLFPIKFLPSFDFLLLAYVCFFLPWCFSPRIMFLHHYLPAVTLVWVLTGGLLSDKEEEKLST